MPTPSADTSDDEVTRVPERGTRVTLTYPHATGNFPRQRVGLVVSSAPKAGTFSVAVQPQGHVIKVVLEEYEREDATWREWTPKDGWPVDRVKKK